MSTVTQQPTLRVMRLYKPSLYPASTAPCISNTAQVFPLSNFLLLPDSFGDLYMGETFRAYVAVINSLAGKTLGKTTLSIKIQTSNTSTTHELYESAADVGEKDLLYDETLTHVIAHRITEIGTYTLRVMVQYEDREVSLSERVTIKKLYRLNVLDPLTIKLQITNNSTQNMCITDVAISPVPGIIVTSVASNQQNSFLPNKQLRPDETTSTGFFVALPPDNQSSGRPSPSVFIGKPLVTWENLFGEGGYYTGESIFVPQRQTPPSAVISLECLSCPRHVKMGEEFKVEMKISIATDALSTKYSLRCDGDSSVTVVGPLVIDLGVLLVGVPKLLSLTLCCLKQGTIDCNSFSIHNHVGLVLKADKVFKIISF